MDNSDPPAKRMRREGEAEGGDAAAASAPTAAATSAVVVGGEAFVDRAALQARVKALQEAGAAAEHGLSGADLTLAHALLAFHPTLGASGAGSASVLGAVRYGEHTRFPGASCFIVTVNAGQRDEREEPASFKKVVEGLFLRPGAGKKAAKVAAALGGASAMIPGANNAGTDAGADVAPAPPPRFGAVPPPATKAGARPKDPTAAVTAAPPAAAAAAVVPWFERPAEETAGTVCVVEGLGRVRPFGAPLTAAELKEAYRQHGPVAFVEHRDAEGKAWVRFATAAGAASAASRPTRLTLGGCDLGVAAVLGSGDLEAYRAVARRSHGAFAANRGRPGSHVAPRLGGGVGGGGGGGGCSKVHGGKGRRGGKGKKKGEAGHYGPQGGEGGQPGGE